MDIFFNYWIIIFGFAATLTTSVLIVITQPFHGNLTTDHTEGVQKFHASPTPRIGGAALLLGYLVVWLAQDGEAKELMGWIGFSGLPVLIFGLAEDISKNIGVGTRMIATLVAGVIFCSTTGYLVETVHLWWIDMFLTTPATSIAFTAFAIGSAANAINIIDGFHGLASGTVLIMLASVGIVAWGAGDSVLLNITLSIASITAGFFLVNFPFGNIFLGDGGAYLLGFLVAVLTVMLAVRNPEVSPWICPLILSYPLTELVVSIARKLRRKGHHPGKPDNLHLHMLVHRFIGNRLNLSTEAEVTHHALTSITLWILPAVSLCLVSISGFEGFFAIRGIIIVFCGYLIVYNAAHIWDQKYNT